MIDDYGLYPREEPFDPFSVMLFKALQIVAFLCFGVVPLVDAVNVKSFRADMARRAMRLASADPEYAKQGDYFWVE